jgi:uncharacterized protein (TIGR00266 family)
MQYKINGTLLQTLEIFLERGETIYTESGDIAWMRGEIDMKADYRGSLIAGLSRMMAGESLILTNYTCRDPNGLVVFTPDIPGKVLDMNLTGEQSLICQKGSFMCAQETVKLEMHFQKKLGAGFFGGEGFILQKITGPGLVFIGVSGELQEFSLALGEEIKVDPGHITMFEPTVNYHITRVKGLKTKFRPGPGLYLANLQGPGKVWLQTLPTSNLAAKLARYMPEMSI